MEKLNVLVIVPIGEEGLRQIAAVSRNIKVWDASDIVTAEREKDFFDKRLDALLVQADVLYGNEPPKGLIARAPRLKWFQTRLTGVDHILDSDIVQSPVIVTNARGIHATPVSELVLEMMLMFAKQAPLCFHAKQERRWLRFTPRVLRSQTVGIVGLGSIGREVARLAKAFGMRVIAADVKRLARARYADMILHLEQLGQLLLESDFVVLTLPLTPETSNLIGERELQAMRSTAYLINVARGGIVDEEALIRALDERWIAGAGLDVFATEPLPTGNKLWEFPNVIFSFHFGARLEESRAAATELFCKNLRRYLDGKKLLNTVNKKKGY